MRCPVVATRLVASDADARHRHADRCRRALIGDSCWLGVDAHDHRHAGAAAAPARRNLGRNAYAHRDALHDLGEIAGRALSGGSNENTAPDAGAKLSTVPSMACSGSASTLDRNLLPRAKASELGFLEVGVDINGIERDQAGEPLTGLHIVAGLHRAITDHAAVDRCTNFRERKIPVRPPRPCAARRVRAVPRVPALASLQRWLARRPVRPVHRQPRRAPGRGWPARSRAPDGSRSPSMPVLC